MKKKMFAVGMAVLLAVLAFNLAFAAEMPWSAKGGDEAAAAPLYPVITSCSWTGNRLSVTWTGVTGARTYWVVARSLTQRNCPTTRVTTRVLGVNRVAVGSCADVVTIQPVERGYAASISKAACNFP